MDDSPLYVSSTDGLKGFGKEVGELHIIYKEKLYTYIQIHLYIFTFIFVYVEIKPNHKGDMWVMFHF